MRPHHLSIEAMGPFAAQVEVDFDLLAHEGLFLIHGPTGSGKTSLLDALCFALYGEVPGQRGDRTLKSDHAPASATPRVSLEFSAQGGRYRVTREPYHEAAKKRGTGTTPHHPTAVLQRLDEPHAGPIATRLSEVKDEVRRLVGLTPSQFQQVILLPQGQFEEVLRGRADTREALLKTLFHTVPFEDLTEWLTEEARTRRGVVTEERRRLTVLAEEAQRRGTDVLPPVADGPQTLFDLSGADKATPDQDALDRLVARADAALGDADGDLRSADAALVAHRRAHEDAAARAERWDRLERARADRRNLEAAETAMAGKRAQRERALVAEQVRPSLDDVTRLGRELRAAEAGASAELARAETVREQLARPLPAVAGLRLAGLPGAEAVAAARQAVAADRAALAALVEVEATATTARADAATQRRAAEAMAATVEQAAQRVLRLQATAADLVADLEASATARDRLEGLAEAARVAEHQAHAAKRLAPARRSLATAEAVLLTGREAANATWAASLDLRTLYLNGIAAVLAGGLEQGGQCPVCGSLEHPVPAQPATGAVTQDQVDAAEAEADRAREQVEAQSGAVTDLGRALAEILAAAGPAADDPKAMETAMDLRADHHAARDLAASRPRLETRHATVLADIRAADHVRTTGGREIDAALASAAHQDAQADVAQQRIAAALGSEGVDLAAALAALDRMDEVLAALAGHATGCDDARRALAQAEDRLATDLAVSSFADLGEAREALVDAAERRALADELELHDRRRVAMEQTLADPQLADLPSARPEVAALRAEVTGAQQLKEHAVAHRSKVHEARVRITELAGEHRALFNRLVPLEADATLHEAVANRCAGRAAPKVSLQRWVLASYLEAICEHANRRLVVMTGGRYQLRVERDTARGGAKAGLDLWVHDAHTGTERSVSSLSGGETFQASLALALGVADSVEARTGGVRLDALFVDEGFGSLDPESLQLAMDELDGLREGGRTVGLISHVAALRERIRVGIEVTASTSGSRVRVGDIAAV